MISKLKEIIFKGGAENKDFREVLKGGSMAFVYRILNMAVGYGIMIFISRKLGDEGIGIYNLCLAILGVLVMISCLGFNTSVVRFVSQYNAEGSIEKIRKLFKGIIRLIVPISLVLGGILYLISGLLANQVYHDPSLQFPFEILAIILPFAVITAFNVEFIRGLKQVHISEFFRNLGIHIVTLIAIIIASLTVLHSYFPMIAYLIGIIAAALITLAYILNYFSKTVKPTVKTEPASESKQEEFSLKSHLIVSLPMILTSFIQLMNGQVDTLMLGLFESQTTGDVGVFTVALKISVVTNFMIGALKSIAMPKISELFWAGKMEALNKVIGQSTKFIFVFAAPVSLILMLFPEFILGLVKPEFASGSNTLRIFALTQLFNASCGLVAIFLNMTGNQVFFTRLVAITTSVNILLNLLLIPILGMEGAAIATLIATVSWNFIGANYIYRKYQIATFFRPGTLFKKQS